jgi:hypothetical protein
LPKKEPTTKNPKDRAKVKPLFTFQNLAFVLVFVIFIVSVVWGEPISHLFTGVQIQDVIPTPTPKILPGTPTPLPVEYLSSAEQTNGIIIGMIVIAIIVLGGIIGVLLRDQSL